MERTIQRKNPPKRSPEVDASASELSPKGISYLLQMSDVIKQVKPRWEQYSDRAPDWALELIKLHNLFEKEMKGE